MKMKVLGFIVCLLLIFPVCSFTAGADPDTELKIYILGSLPVRLYSRVMFGEISNTGNTTAYNVSYEMRITGGFQKTINLTMTGYEPELLPGHFLAIAVVYVHGFGPISITMNAAASNAETISDTAKGYQIGSFSWIPFSWFSLLQG